MYSSLFRRYLYPTENPWFPSMPIHAVTFKIYTRHNDPICNKYTISSSNNLIETRFPCGKIRNRERKIKNLRKKKIRENSSGNFWRLVKGLKAFTDKLKLSCTILSSLGNLRKVKALHTKRWKMLAWGRVSGLSLGTNTRHLIVYR